MELLPAMTTYNTCVNSRLFDPSHIKIICKKQQSTHKCSSSFFFSKEDFKEEEEKKHITLKTNMHDFLNGTHKTHTCKP